MRLEERVLEKQPNLPADKQKEVLDFVDFLRKKNGSKKPLGSLRGLWQDLNTHITDAHLADPPRDTCGNAPPHTPRPAATSPDSPLLPHLLPAPPAPAT